jgi:tetratricopeptide (TPR) repeat protein
MFLSRSRQILTAVLLGLPSLALAKDAPVERFLSTLETMSVPGEARSLLRERWAACQDCDANEFLTQALAVISTELRQGLDFFDADEYERSVVHMAGLVADNNPFVSVHAAVYEIKALVELERLVEAAERIAKLRADGSTRLAAHSYFAPEIEFLYGFCLLADLQYDEAEETLTRFIGENADAPGRLLMAAKQMLVELANREPERLGEVTDLMNYSGRRLKSADGGDLVQSRQQRIIDLLDRLIKDAEEQEKNSCKSSSSGSGSGRSSTRSPANPMQESRLPGGSPRDESLRAGRRANPGEVWGNMPPGERERILQALRESFPSRYRQLVEQYYEELAKKP